MRLLKQLRCKKCNHTFNPTKRKRKYQCSSCGKKGTVGRSEVNNFQIYTSKDFKIILDYLQEEQHDLETLRIAQEIKEARERGETMKVPHTKKTSKSRPKPKGKPGRPKVQLKPGQIEYLHNRHREYRDRTGKDPSELMVRAWLEDSTDHNKSMCSRLAMDYLQNHTPKEYSQ